MQANHYRSHRIVVLAWNHGRAHSGGKQPSRIEKRRFLADRNHADDEIFLLRQLGEITELMRFTGAKGTGNSDTFHLRSIGERRPA